MPDELDLESHLADRLKETRDWADFGRKKPPAGSESVERVMEVPGAEHLGGRKISDVFKRSGAAPKHPAAAPVDDDAPRKRGLEHHLKSRLAEIEDKPLGRSAVDDMLAKYQENRRKLGGTS